MPPRTGHEEKKKHAAQGAEESGDEVLTCSEFLVHSSASIGSALPAAGLGMVNVRRGVRCSLGFCPAQMYHSPAVRSNRAVASVETFVSGGAPFL